MLEDLLVSHSWSGYIEAREKYEATNEDRDRDALHFAYSNYNYALYLRDKENRDHQLLKAGLSAQGFIFYE